MKTMSNFAQKTWPYRLDSFCMFTGSLVPLGIVIGNAGFESMIALTGLCWIVRCFAAKKNPLKKTAVHPLVLPWLFWLAVIFISLLINGAGTKGWAHDFVLIRYLIYAAALIDISERRPVFKYMLTGLGAGIIWGALNTLSAHLIGFDFLGKPLARYLGKLKEPARISSIAAYAAPFFLSWALLDRSLSKKKKFFLISIGVLGLIEIFLFKIRTVYIASLSGLFFLIIYINRKRFLLLFALFAAVIMGFYSLFLFDIKPNINLRSFYDRIYIWKVSGKIWAENPVVGSGVSGWRDTYTDIATSEKVPSYTAPDGSVWRQTKAYHAHNLILMIMSASGSLGLFTFLWLFINVVRGVFKDTEKWRAGLIVWPAVFLVIGLTGWNIYASQYQTIFAFFTAMTGIQVFNNGKTSNHHHPSSH
jgi:O-antigen ligase